MLQGSILAVLEMIELFLPLVTGTQSQQTVTQIDKIIKAIEGLLPYIATWSSTIYTVASNILTTLQNGDTVSADQKAATRAILAQVSAGWNAIEAKIDPDNPANAGTPAGDDPATPTA